VTRVWAERPENRVSIPGRGRARTGRGLYRVLVGRPEGKRPLGRPRHRWEDNIKMDLQEVGCGGMNWIDVAQDRDRLWALVHEAMNLWVPKNAGNFLASRQPVSFARRTLLRGVWSLTTSYCISCGAVCCRIVAMNTMQFSAYASKGKAVPLNARTGPKISRSLRLPDFKTMGTWRW